MQVFDEDLELNDCSRRDGGEKEKGQGEARKEEVEENEAAYSNGGRRRDGHDSGDGSGGGLGGTRGRSWIAFRGRAQTVNVRSKEEGTFAAIRNDRRGYSRLNDSARNKYCSSRKLSIGYGNWMFRIGERRGREREKRRNRWCSQTILHRVLTVGKSIRDSRFDLYDQIPVAATTG